MIQVVSEIQDVPDLRARAGEDPRVERSRAAALNAARELFLERGWAAVTHASVAERAGVGRSTIYRHWPEPPSLLRDILVDGVSLVHPKPTGILREDLVEELEVLRAHLSVERNLKAIIAILERARNEQAFAELPGEIHLAGSQGLRSILSRACGQGQLRADIDMEQAVAELVGPLMWRTVIIGRPLTRAFVLAIVDDFLAAHVEAHGPG